jgi:hypothetical protein
MNSRAVAITGLSIGFALAGSAAMAECQSWDLLPKFNAVQANGFNVVFELSKTGENEYHGSAHYYTGSDFHEVRGDAGARLDGPRVDIWVAWRTSPSGGNVSYYKGNISDGILSGLTLDPTLPKGAKDREVFWRSNQTFKCAFAVNARRHELIRQRARGGRTSGAASSTAAVSQSVSAAHAGMNPALDAIKSKLGALQPAPTPPAPVPPAPTPPAGPPIKTASVEKDVDVYAPAGGGKSLGVLRNGSTVSLLEARTDGWCHVKGGAVPGGEGWVYSAADYRSLKF